MLASSITRRICIHLLKTKPKRENLQRALKSSREIIVLLVHGFDVKIYCPVLGKILYRFIFSLPTLIIDTQTNHQSALETQRTLYHTNTRIQATAAAITSYGKCKVWSA